MQMIFPPGDFPPKVKVDSNTRMCNYTLVSVICLSNLSLNMTSHAKIFNISLLAATSKTLQLYSSCSNWVDILSHAKDSDTIYNC